MGEVVRGEVERFGLEREHLDAVTGPLLKAFKQKKGRTKSQNSLLLLTRSERRLCVYIIYGRTIRDLLDALRDSGLGHEQGNIVVHAGRAWRRAALARRRQHQPRVK